MNNDDDGDDDDKDNNVGVLAWRAVKNVCLFFWLSTVACLSVTRHTLAFLYPSICRPLQRICLSGVYTHFQQMRTILIFQPRLGFQNWESLI